MSQSHDPDFKGLSGLTRLIYASRWSGKAGLDLRHETQSILIASIANNRSRDVTGLLLSLGDRFIQALEGPASGVQAIYARVLEDPRHDQISLLSLGSASSRRFRDWNMTTRRLESAALNELRDRGLHLDPQTINGEQALDLLAAVAGTHSRT